MQANVAFGQGAAADRNSGERHTASRARSAAARPSRPACWSGARIAAGTTAAPQGSSCNCAAKASGENGWCNASFAPVISQGMITVPRPAKEEVASALRIAPPDSSAASVTMALPALTSCA
jgi:hypothetical protein